MCQISISPRFIDNLMQKHNFFIYFIQNSYKWSFVTCYLHSNNIEYQSLVLIIYFVSQIQESMISYDLSCAYKSSSDSFDYMTYYRYALMATSCLFLFLNILWIISHKLYVYTTLKLFMWVQITYFIGMIVVLPYGSYMNDGYKRIKVNESVQNCVDDIITHENPGITFLCSIDAYVNLAMYNISYFFGVLISLNVRKVLDNTHRKFMQQFRNIIVVIIVIIFIVYGVPFFLSFIEQSVYSYGPVGFYLFQGWVVPSNDKYYSFFWCGICNRSQEDWVDAASSLNMVLLPAIMFIFHSILLLNNWRSMKGLEGLEQINPRHYFIISTGRFGFFLFIMQLLNFIKFIFVEVSGSNNAPLIIIITIMNLSFDWFPILLVGLFWYYYAKDMKKFNNPEIRYDSRENKESLVTNSIIKSVKM